MSVFPEFAALPASSQKYYFDYFIEKAKSKQKEHKKKVKKAQKKMGRHLESVADLSDYPKVTESVSK